MRMELSQVVVVVVILAASCLCGLNNAARTLSDIDAGLLSSDVAAKYWMQSLQQPSVPHEIARLFPKISAAEAERVAGLLGKSGLSNEAVARFCSATEMACADQGTYVGNADIGSQVWYYGPGSALGYYGLKAPAGHHAEHLFFREADLHDTSFEFRASDAIENWALQRAFLPRAVASVLQGPTERALSLLHIADNSRIANAVRGTNHFCGELSQASEDSNVEKWWQGVATCVASAEDLADFVAEVLHPEPLQLRVNALPGTDMDAVRSLDEATVQAVAAGNFRVVGSQLKKDVSGSFIACHVMPSAFQTMLCHSQPSSKLYWVTLESTGSPGTYISELAVCHMDTSDWNPDHRSFEMLGTKPGQAEACHWANFGFLALFVEDAAALPVGDAAF